MPGSRVGGFQVPHRRHDPALILGRAGVPVRLLQPRNEGALLLGQLGGEVVGRDAPTKLQVQAIGAATPWPRMLKAGQGVAKFLLLRRRYVGRGQRRERVGQGLLPLPSALVLGCVAGSGLDRGESVRRPGLLLDERLEPAGQLGVGARSGLADQPLEIARGLVRRSPCLIEGLPGRCAAGRGIGQRVGQMLQRDLRPGLLCGDLAGRRFDLAQPLGSLPCTPRAVRRASSA